MTINARAKIGKESGKYSVEPLRNPSKYPIFRAHSERRLPTVHPGVKMVGELGANLCDILSLCVVLNDVHKIIAVNNSGPNQAE